MFKFDENRLDREADPLGQGEFAHVFPYQKNAEDTRWVVKCIHAQNFRKFMRTLQEVVIGFSLDHPALLPNKGFYAEQEKPTYKVYVKLPRMKMTMMDLLLQQQKTGQVLSEAQILSYFHTLISGLEYLHSRQIAHRDIKLSNLLLDYNDQVKLSDVGIAAFVGDEDQYYANPELFGPENYLAPKYWLKATS